MVLLVVAMGLLIAMVLLVVAVVLLVAVILLVSMVIVSAMVIVGIVVVIRSSAARITVGTARAVIAPVDDRHAAGVVDGRRNTIARLFQLKPQLCQPQPQWDQIRRFRCQCRTIARPVPKYTPAGGP